MAAGVCCSGDQVHGGEVTETVSQGLVFNLFTIYSTYCTGEHDHFQAVTYEVWIGFLNG